MIGEKEKSLFRVHSETRLFLIATYAALDSSFYASSIKATAVCCK